MNNEDPRQSQAALTTTPEVSADEAIDAEDGVYVLPEEETTVLLPPPTFEELPVVVAELEEDTGFLEEEILEPTTASTTNPQLVVPPIMKLERGEYALLTQQSAGRVLAKAPDGSEVLVAIYARGADVTRALYPHPMLPALLDAGEYENKTLIAHPKLDGVTLETAIAQKDIRSVVSAVVDLARLNRYLHARGFATVAVDPRDVLLNPTRLQRLPGVHKIGDVIGAEAPRYGAPERAAGAKINGIEGVYSLGALLYHGLTGQMPIEGEMLVTYPNIPGAPQALTAMLATATTRVNPGDALELCAKLERALTKRYFWQIGTASTVGINPDRITNEDSVGYRMRRSMGDNGADTYLVACVADGIGGMAKGEDASQAAISGFMDYPLSEVSNQSVLEAISLANARVIGAMEGKSGGCTFTGIIADGDKLALCHVGDTRAYLITDTVQQISEDHSMVAMFVKMGIISAEAAHNHPDSNKIMRALGSVRELPPDYVEVREFTMPTNAKLVIVSDGVWGVFPPSEFAVYLQEPLEPQDLADRLVRVAIEHNTSDNATALVLKLEERAAI